MTTISHLEKAGITLERLQREYDNGATFSDLEKMFQPLVSVKVDRKVFSAIWKQYGLRRRIRSEEYAIRVNSIKKTRIQKKKVRESEADTEEIIRLYKNGKSIIGIHQELGTSKDLIRQILVKNNVHIRQQVTVKTIIQDLENNGLTLEKLTEFYIHQNHDYQRTMDFIQEFTQYLIYKRTSEKIIRHYGLVKPPELIKELQGRKSRREKIVNMQKLSKAGFDSTQEVADHYFENKHLTKTALVNLLNSRLNGDDEPFTMRWIERHVHPLIPEERLCRVSRVEREMVHFLEQSFPNVEFVLNTRSVITPYELDVYIPELNIAIEFNGDFWHSDKFLIPNHGMTAFEYHKNKFDLAHEKGVTVAFVWESNWVNNTESTQKSLVKFMESEVIDECLSF